MDRRSAGDLGPQPRTVTGDNNRTTDSQSSGTSTARQPKVQQPKPQALPHRSGPSAILVSTRQKGNPILNHIKLLPWEYADIPADYVVGTTTCALFLSLKYHRLHPEYIYSRVRLLAGKYSLRLVLVMVDIPNHEDALKELSKTSIINNLTLMLCWSAPEAAHYLELFKSSEHAQPTAIRTQQAQSYKESLVEFVTAPRSINKSDTASLISTFGSLQNAINAQPEQLSSVPGWGEKKVQQWCNAVREGFRVETTKKATASGPTSQNRTPRPALRPQAASADEDEDEDEVILRSVLAESRATAPAAAAANESSKDAQPSEAMSEGIMAALAKLRDNGG
ncbi:Mating-type switching protein swi10 [Penicillium hispanicum]|uniref:Mating-type switching protein swi10 n=1 Tax=Penicillium hispanicum TaxID=1080232 RepID=UPI002541DE5A|nr:Mating-type switching protein swi10 [Penicillium hispanicum]KAJ5570412.1 Mating-type switching protein swi10 [Penicillium hispanicum]